MHLAPILLGDRTLTAYGWLVVSSGSVRAILTPAGRDYVVHCWACDERLRVPPGFGVLNFTSLDQATDWMADRLDCDRNAVILSQPIGLEKNSSASSRSSNPKFASSGQNPHD